MENELLSATIRKTGLNKKQVEHAIFLLNDGNTVPFIARYRKEQTGGLDELQLKEIADTYEYEKNVYTRKEEITRLIDEQGKLSVELKEQIKKADKLQQLEDIYRPFKQKRRTRATIAKEKGLSPLAEKVLSFPFNFDQSKECELYLNEEHDLNDEEAVLAGLRDIIAENVAEDPKIREALREKALRQSIILRLESKKLKMKKGFLLTIMIFKNPLAKIVPHRTLALNRGEKEQVLRVGVQFQSDAFIDSIKRLFVKKKTSPVVPIVEEAIKDSFTRLLEPSLEREVRSFLTEKAEEQAISIFAENLKQLLLQPPIKGQVILGIDPAFRTGCKWAVIDATGKTLDIGVIYPTAPHHKTEEATKIVIDLIQEYGIEMIAVGNGTASRETEQFIVSVIKQVNQTVYYVIVNEAGASVYSASELARKEFPQLQVEQRSAISIARRLQDPLAELVKIDPKSVGVGQYQHDVSQKKLTDSLAFIVETVVNQVGVNVNTASSALLSHVAGLNKVQAANIVAHRDEQGPFQNRVSLKKVPRLGAKTYEQCIGFLRVQGSDNPFDATGIHPESYKSTQQLIKHFELSLEDIGTNRFQEKVKKEELATLAKDLAVGMPTLIDILDALARPNRDPRDDVPAPQLKQDVLKMEDLAQGMELQGTVRNVVDFGAFIDIGVKQDGLVHISKLTNRYVKHPMEVVSIGDVVTVWVDSIDLAKERIGLTMKKVDN
ncbi:LOW QUALITY PROTEIN: transcription accessory protein [Bacillus sp. JCM 19045]|nr:LOW QUALITY PROTEIN: transcription accessory protein [Bacillus sp. JCM 19045]